MSDPDIKLSKLELEVMTAFWNVGPCTLSEAFEGIPKGNRKSEYTTVQTIVTRLEAKGAIRRVKKAGNAWIYEPAINRQSVVGKIVDDLLGILDGAASPIVSHLAESGKLSQADIDEIAAIIAKSQKKP